MLADAQKRGEVQALLKLDPGLAAEFLSRSGFRPKDRLILGKKGRPRKLNLSEQDRLILEEAEKFFQKNPLPTFKPSRKITKKKRGDDTPPTAPVTRK